MGARLEQRGMSDQEREYEREHEGGGGVPPSADQVESEPERLGPLDYAQRHGRTLGWLAAKVLADAKARRKAEREGKTLDAEK